jgi:hypothetical protein
MAALHDADGKPTKAQVFKKCRARARIQGNLQIPLHTYDPLRVSAAVVHPAGIHLVNIIIVNFGLYVFKIDDPKAFCQGEAGCPIYTKVPKGVEHIHEEVRAVWEGHKMASYGSDIWINTGELAVLPTGGGCFEGHWVSTMQFREDNFHQAFQLTVSFHPLLAARR